MMTKAQAAMVEDGAPSFVFMTAKERAEAWKRSPPRPMPSFQEVRTIDAVSAALKAELEERNRIKAKNRIAKMLALKKEEVDRRGKGKRWCVNTCRWINTEERPTMMSITTNTRGSTQMTTQKDFADMSGPELVAAYNKLSDKPVKRFATRAAALKRLAEATTAKAKAKGAASTGNGKAATAKKADVNQDKVATEFGARPNSPTGKLITAFNAKFGKQVPLTELAAAAYGSKNVENISPCAMRVRVAMKTIVAKKLPYEIRREKGANKELSFGLYKK